MATFNAAKIYCIQSNESENPNLVLIRIVRIRPPTTSSIVDRALPWIARRQQVVKKFKTFYVSLLVYVLLVKEGNRFNPVPSKISVMLNCKICRYKTQKIIISLRNKSASEFPFPWGDAYYRNTFLQVSG